MEQSSFLIVAIGFVILTIVFFGLLLRELKIALPKTELTPETQKRVFRNVLIALIGWFVVVSALSLTGVLLDFSSLPPKLTIVLIIPFITILVVTFSKKLKSILLVVPSETIVKLQSFRIFVEVLLWMLFVQHLLPEQMTFEGFNFDVISGLTAPIVAYLFTRTSLPKGVVIAWNILCLGLLINIVTIAMLSMPTVFRVFMNEPSNTIVAHFPIVLLPAFLVPLAYGLHFFSLRQLAIKR